MLRLFSERTLFIASKVVGLVIRPLTLLLLLQFGQDSLARDLALILTAVASSFIFLNNQNYRRAYQHFFNTSQDVNGSLRGLRGRYIFHDYAAGVVIHMILFLPLSAVALWLWLGSADLLLYAIILVLSEKFYDDDQRALVYKRRYYEWSLNFAFRVILPSLAFLAALLINGQSTIVVYVAATVLCFTIYAVFLRKQFFRLLAKVIIHRLAPSFLSELRRYLFDYRREFLAAQIWAVVAANVVMIDRFLVSKASPEVFAQYILVVNIANIVMTFHNLGYVTFRRPTLLLPGTSSLHAILAWQNLIFPLLLAVAALTIHFVPITFGQPLTNLPICVIVAVTMLYLFQAYSLVPKEIAFWRLKRGLLLVCDGSTLLLPLIAFLFGLQTPLLIAVSTCAAVVLRVVALALLLQYPSHLTHLSSEQNAG